VRGFSDETTPHQLLFDSFGVPLRVCASTEDVLARIEPHLPLERTDGGSVLTARRLGIVSEDDLTFSVYNATVCVSDRGDLDLALVTLEDQVRSYISLHAPGFVFVRAGVVGYGGHTLVIPGDAFSGKTTLVAALVRAGARYYSDEYAVIDADGRVHPYANAHPLANAGPDGAQVAVNSQEHIAAAGREPLPVGLVAVTHFIPGAEWLPATVTGAAAAVELLGYTPTITTRPEDAMKAITRALDGASMLKGERGEADEVAGSLLDAVSASARG
jgi:hypothetical protein